MRVRWLGHSAFMVTADDGTVVITDPYGNSSGLSYAPIEGPADVLTVSHRHGDHFGARVKGTPHVISEPGKKKEKGIEFTGVAAYHDTKKGTQRGQDIIVCFTVDKVRICHLGDLGHLLSEAQLSQIGQVDILMVPVGGVYTIDAADATKVCEQIKPRIILPMHYKTDKCEFPLAEVDDFLQGKTNVKRPDTSDLELEVGQLPQSTEIIVLKYAR